MSDFKWTGGGQIVISLPPDPITGKEVKLYGTVHHLTLTAVTESQPIYEIGSTQVVEQLPQSSVVHYEVSGIAIEPPNPVEEQEEEKIPSRWADIMDEMEE